MRCSACVVASIHPGDADVRLGAVIGFCSSPQFIEHPTSPYHPERPDRIRAILKAVRDAGLVNSPSPFPDFCVDLGVRRIEPPLPALVELAPDPADVRWLLSVHTPEMIERVRHVSAIGGGVLDQGDTPIGPPSYGIALLAVGAVLRCCDAVMNRRVRRAFAAVRPPGHHAEPDRSMGFCLFNNVAIAARYVQQIYGVQRIAIVDVDVHHGNGTQVCFDNDPHVLFCSIHQDPRTCYPGSGHRWETGTGTGRGYTINVPLNPGTTDAQYRHALDRHIVAELEQFRPGMLLVSIGFDAHRDDPLASIELSDDAYELMTRSLCDVAERRCDGRLVSVLEGGYNLKALARSVVRHLIGMM
jgi:acetoin utilization deacetylase AcuC-like enzyme